MDFPVLLQVMVAVSIYSNGIFHHVNGNIHGVSKSSVSRAVYDVSSALCRISRIYIRLPGDGKIIYSLMQKFFSAIAILCQILLMPLMAPTYLIFTQHSRCM